MKIVIFGKVQELHAECQRDDLTLYLSIKLPVGYLPGNAVQASFRAFKGRDVEIDIESDVGSPIG
jgi:hypothetical protein